MCDMCVNPDEWRWQVGQSTPPTWEAVAVVLQLFTDLRPRLHSWLFKQLICLALCSHTHTHRVRQSACVCVCGGGDGGQEVKYLFKTQVSEFQRFVCVIRQHTLEAEAFTSERGWKHWGQSAKLLILARMWEQHFPWANNQHRPFSQVWFLVLKIQLLQLPCSTEVGVTTKNAAQRVSK